jgi:hypothetical protein
MMSKSLGRAFRSAGVIAALIAAQFALVFPALSPSPAAAGITRPPAARPAAVTPASQPVTGIASTSDSAGYWQVAADGSVYSSGDASGHGELPPAVPNAPIVGMARTPGNGGYWLVGADGGVFSYGNAGFYGSAGSLNLSAQIVAIVPTSDGAGYWLVGADGGVFSYGDAAYDGGLPGLGVSVDDVVGAARYRSGYCMLRANGWVYCFAPGDHDQLAPGGIQFDMARPATAIAATPDGDGYWAVDQKGEVFTEGTAGYAGGLGSDTLNAPIIGIAAGATDDSYGLAGSDGGIFTFNTSYVNSVSVSPELAPGDAENAARAMLPEFDAGTPASYSCLVNLWNAESNWRWNADNPASGAYGIPQALPAAKMASAGPDYLTNAFTQLLWGLGYIKSTYGSPCAAWAHEQKYHWYGVNGPANLRRS